MANLSEPSSSLSFVSSSHGSVGQNSLAGGNIEVVTLNKLSSNLEQLLVDSGSSDYSDADITVEGVSIGVHRCILAARSNFFRNLFEKEKGSLEKPNYHMTELLPYGNVGYEAFLIFLTYLYTGKLRPSPKEVSVCVDSTCAHDACRPAIDFAAELLYASSVFQVSELFSLFQRRLLNFVEKTFVEDVFPILMVAFHCQSSQLLTQCIERVARSDLDKVTIEKELPFEIAEDIRLLRLKSLPDDHDPANHDQLREKRIRRIHKALDSDDVELVKLLLTESEVTLDDANALHYAVAYCDPKVVSEVLALGLADVNLRNARGYTVLHVAAMRKEPSILISLLTKGASTSELILDGQSAVNICRRLTRPKDYDVNMQQGRETNKGRMCIDILEGEMRRTSIARDTCISSSVLAEDMHMRLLYLENRVAFARLFFPSEAKVAMDIANAETTSEFTGLSAPKNSSGKLREVDLNETPAMRTKRLQSRMEALMKTVETGRRFFPHCSEVLDKKLDDDDLLDPLENGTPDEQRMKRTRFSQLKMEVLKAFNKDKAEFGGCGLSSSSSSSSLNGITIGGVKKKHKRQG